MICGFLFSAALFADENERQIEITVETDTRIAEWKPIWRFFGADEPNYATMKDGRALLGELGALRPDQVFFRAHNLFTSGDGSASLKWGSTNIYTEDESGKPVYDFSIIDGIMDAYRQNKLRPYMQLGFMPKALSIKSEPYRHSWTPTAKYDEIYTGWSHPPKDYDRWGELVYQWALHCVQRYGKSEVANWYWQTWNEPNIGYWQGSREDWFKLNDYALAAVRRALPEAKVGGPDVAGGPGGDFLESYLRHCIQGKNYATGKTGTPLDFVSFHAKGWPEIKDGHVRMGMANQLRDIDKAFAVIAKFPEIKNIPVIIGESDPEGCAACQGSHLAYRNGTMYSSYTAASFPRKVALARRRGVNLEGALTWAFEFEGQPYFAGFRSLATRGIDKPVLNAFRLMAKLEGDQLLVKSDGEIPLDEILKTGVRQRADISAVATISKERLAVLLWHYHDVDVAGPAARITLKLDGYSVANKSVTQYKINDTSGNSFSRWLALGSPQNPTQQQLQEIKCAGKLTSQKPDFELVNSSDGSSMTFALPRQAVYLLVFE